MVDAGSIPAPSSPEFVICSGSSNATRRCVASGNYHERENMDYHLCLIAIVSALVGVFFAGCWAEKLSNPSISDEPRELRIIGSEIDEVL